MHRYTREIYSEGLWKYQKGGFPLNELYTTVLMFFALLATWIFGLVTGNWIALKILLGLLVGVVVFAVLVGALLDFLDNRRRSREIKTLYGDLVRLLELLAADNDAGATDEAEKRVRGNRYFPARFADHADELLALFRNIPLPLRGRVVDIMVRSVPFDLVALELLISTPIDAASGRFFRGWIKADDNLSGLLAVFQACFEDPSRGDQKELAARIMDIAKRDPTPEYAATLKPFRPYLEAARRYYGSEMDREMLDRYIEQWDVGKQQGFSRFDFLGVIVLVAALAGSVIYGQQSGNWYLLLGVVLLLPLKLLIERLFQSDPEERAKRALHQKLARYLELSAAGSDAAAIGNAEQQVMQAHYADAALYRCQLSEQLQELYRRIEPERREQPRMTLLKTTRGSMVALQLFLQTPVGPESLEAFREWLMWWSKKMPEVLEPFRASLEDVARGDRAELSSLLIGIVKPDPAPEQASALKSFRPYLEARRDAFSEKERQTLDRYIGCWDAEGGGDQ